MERRGGDVWKVLPHLSQSIERYAKLLYAGFRDSLCMGKVLNQVLKVCVERYTFSPGLIVQRCLDLRS